MNRITNRALINNTLANIMNNYDRMSTLQNQISTGKKILAPSDDPIGAVFSIKSNARVNEIDQYSKNLGQARFWLESSESAVSSVGDVLTRVKELAVRGANGTLTQDDRDKVATELNGLLEHMISLANSDQAGDYLFGGSKVQQRPFEIQSGRPANIGGRTIVDQILNVGYLGDTGAIQRNESSSTKLQVNEDGESAFFNVTRQAIYSQSSFADPNGQLTDSLRTGYLTISGRIGDEVIKIDAGDSLREIANKITSQSRQVAAKVVPVTGGYRLEIEALRDGKNNQVSIAAGGPPGIERTRTNLLDLLGMSSEITTLKAEGSSADRISAIEPNLSGGYFFINDNLVAVDPAKDTLGDVARRINALKQDVRADVIDGALHLRSTGTMVIKDGTSNFPSKMGFPTQRLASGATLVDNTVRQVPLQANEWVKNGNFRLNGASVGILDVAKQTVADIVASINATGSGVTARVADLATDGYDDRIVIEAAPGQRIGELTDGTSQFVKSFQFAFKSDSTATPDPDLNLNSIGISGDFTLKGTTFSITGADTLRTLASRINAAALGVQASIEPDLVIPGNERFVLEPVGMKDNFDTRSYSETGNLFASIGFANRIESKVDVTSPLIERPLAANIGAGFAAGTIVVNDKEFAFDPATMQLQDVADQINASDLALHASVSDDNRLVLDGQDALSAMDATVWRSDPLAAGIDPATTPLSDPLFVPPIGNGDLFVNGKKIMVDPTGTLNQLIAQINAADAGVVATFDPTANGLRIRNTVEGGPVFLVEPTAGEPNVLAALGLDKQANRGTANFFRALGMQDETIQDALGNTFIGKSSTQGKSLFDIVIELRDKLLTGDLAGIGEDQKDPLGHNVLVPSSLRLIDEAIAHNSEIQTRFGSKMNRVDQTEARYRDVKQYLEQIIADNEDVDMEKAIIDYNALQNVYTASLQVGARTIQRTLMDFLS